MFISTCHSTRLGADCLLMECGEFQLLLFSSATSIFLAFVATAAGYAQVGDCFLHSDDFMDTYSYEDYTAARDFLVYS